MAVVYLFHVLEVKRFLAAYIAQLYGYCKKIRPEHFLNIHYHFQKTAVEVKLKMSKAYN